MMNYLWMSHQNRRQLQAKDISSLPLTVVRGM